MRGGAPKLALRGRPFRNHVILAACLAAAGATLATGVSAQSRADPADPSARVPAAVYRSPFAEYRALGDEAVGSWRNANDEVARIGGWREYAREAQQDGPKPPAAAPSKTGPVAPAPGGHAGHGDHGAGK